jgi:hypothetical protein
VGSSFSHASSLTELLDGFVTIHEAFEQGISRA